MHLVSKIIQMPHAVDTCTPTTWRLPDTYCGCFMIKTCVGFHKCWTDSYWTREPFFHHSLRLESSASKSPLFGRQAKGAAPPNLCASLSGFEQTHVEQRCVCVSVLFNSSISAGCVCVCVCLCLCVCYISEQQTTTDCNQNHTHFLQQV